MTEWLIVVSLFAVFAELFYKHVVARYADMAFHDFDIDE